MQWKPGFDCHEWQTYCLTTYLDIQNMKVVYTIHSSCYMHRTLWNRITQNTGFILKWNAEKKEIYQNIIHNTQENTEFNINRVLSQDLTGLLSDHLKTRTFNIKTYERNTWFCGWPESNLLYCFPCTLLDEGEEEWTKKGVCFLAHLTQKKKSKNINNQYYTRMLF